jgi:hypothetical protein
MTGMRTGASARIAAALLVALLLALGCGSCTGTGEAPPAPATSDPLGPVELRAAALRLVADREEALVAGDREAFLATVDDDALQFSATQARWFDNLSDMPVGDLRLEPAGRGAGEPAAEATAEDGELRLPVDFTMRLEGYEEHSVTQRLVYTFREVDGEVRLVNDRDAARDRRTGWLPDPWDVGDVEVRESGSILAFFDEETAPYADSVMQDLQASQETVLAAVPGWSGRLVAYDISDLTGLEERTPMKVWETGGVAYPVPVRPGSHRVAAYRFVVNPEVAHNSLRREFLLRHELAHVALATRDDASPRWLVEGAAEHVSRTQYPAAEQRRMAGYVAAYLDGTVPDLADGADFYAWPDVSYGLAAAACTYLAATRGEQSLWDLMDAFTAEGERLGLAGPVTAGQADAVLVRQVGVDSRELARRALAWAAGG